MIEGVELRDVRTFLAVAETLHFGRAAEQVGLTPSRVSQSIRSLESRLGGLLFDRTSRRVALTPLGMQLRDDLRPAHAALVAALVAAREATHAVTGELVLGLLHPAGYGGKHLTRIVRTFEARHPTCTVVLRELPLAKQLEWLRAGGGDGVVIRLPIDPDDADDLTIGPVLTDDDRMLAVAADHPLASKDQVDAEDLADYAVTYFPAWSAATQDAFIPPRTPSGRLLRRRALHSLAEVLPTVALGTVVHPTVRLFAEHIHHPGVVFVPLNGLPRSRTALAWPARKASVRMLAFARVAEDTLAQARSTD
ncbi:LysR family transcriptional regulator [Actinomycetes bacterium KLBMP 9759]